MNRLVALLCLCLLMIGLTGCQREEARQLIAIKGKIFIFNVRLARAYAEITLTRQNGVPDGAMVVARFENPAGGPALQSAQKIFPAMTRIDLQSPDMACIVKDRPYAITITLAGPDGRTLQTIETTLSSSLDQTVLPTEALVTGPAYDANPAALAPDGTYRLQDRTGCPQH